MQDYYKETARRLGISGSNSTTGDRCTNCGSTQVILVPTNNSENSVDLLEEYRICCECEWNLDLEIFNNV